ncbi:hypothetical protein [Nocardia asteroides]|uniref:hypothetical protein n=1 Tax=Nocardia asteroides TaxID=1824 RepID=UPI001E2E1768|nr:hypothetical protein [Nocardia asteroides]UGT65115.1 hypothetical protein LTT61_24355 [Nocardia asteroides]
MQEWERRLERELAEIRRSGDRLADAVAAVRGRGDGRGVLVEVDAGGDITDLRIAPGAMRSSSNQLTAALLDCHRRARADAKSKVDRLLNTADPRIHDQIQRLHARQPLDNRGRSLSDEEIRAADDAYFERRNRDGWTDAR